MDERTRRIGLNEALFREVNERLEALNETFGAFTDRMSVICECGDPDCGQQLSIGVREYEELRADPALFAVAPGHDAPDVESVVGQRDGYDVVRKHAGTPARLAAETDPRS